MPSSHQYVPSVCESGKLKWIDSCLGDLLGLLPVQRFVAIMGGPSVVIHCWCLLPIPLSCTSVCCSCRTCTLCCHVCEFCLFEVLPLYTTLPIHWSSRTSLASCRE